MIPEKDKEILDDTLDCIIGQCRMRCAGGNYARLCAEERMHGMLLIYRHLNPGTDEDFSVTKLVDAYKKHIAQELNY